MTKEGEGWVHRIYVIGKSKIRGIGMELVKHCHILDNLVYGSSYFEIINFMIMAFSFSCSDAG